MKRLLRLAALTLLLQACPALAASQDYSNVGNRLTESIAEYKTFAVEEDGYDAVFHRDPMVPIIDVQGNVSAPSALMNKGLSVAGVIFSNEQPFVVIDGDLFGAGELVGPYTIVEIKPDGILARRKNEAQDTFVPINR